MLRVALALEDNRNIRKETDVPRAQASTTANKCDLRGPGCIPGLAQGVVT